MGRFSHILLASDFDRTLTDRFSRIPQANLDAIAEFEREGGAFTVATGRSIPMFRAKQAGIPSNVPLVLYNGAACYDYERDALTDAVWMPRAKELLCDMARRFPDLMAEVQGLDYHYLLGEDAMRLAFYRSNEAAAKQASPDTLPERILKIAFFGSFHDTSVRQFFEATPAELEYFQTAGAYMMQAYGADLVVDRAAARILDVQARGVSKGAALKRLAARLGRRVLVCAGDALNDLSMLDAADLAFVPSDCQPSLLQRGYEVVCSCDEGTIGGVLQRLYERF